MSYKIEVVDHTTSPIIYGIFPAKYLGRKLVRNKNDSPVFTGDIKECMKQVGNLQ